MDQLLHEINEDLNKDKLRSFFKKYKFILFFIIAIILLSVTIFVSRKIYLEQQSKKSLQSFLNINYLIDQKNFQNAKDELWKLTNSSINIYKNLAFSKLLELESNNPDTQKKIFEKIESSNLNRDDKTLFQIKRAILFFDNLDEKELLRILDIQKFKNSPWETLALDVIGDFYQSKNQNQKAKEFYNKIINLKNLPDIFKQDIQRKINRLG
ncbi:MAG: tetratricopeptide repeat protein [Pelagibacterales bacterium]|jgi:hypothetical protein|nr:tetratricopeptide repeat protein [Pelagibacterales bacterium]